MMTLIPRHLFAKIGQHKLAQTHRCMTIIDHSLQHISFNPLSFWWQITLTQNILMHCHILPIVKQNTICRSSIPSSTACLLVITFHIPWHLVMDYIPYITFINTHAKRIGGYHNLHFVKGVPVLLVLALFIR